MECFQLLDSFLLIAFFSPIIGLIAVAYIFLKYQKYQTMEIFHTDDIEGRQKGSIVLANKDEIKLILSHIKCFAFELGRSQEDINIIIEAPFRVYKTLKEVSLTTIQVRKTYWHIKHAIDQFLHNHLVS